MTHANRRWAPWPSRFPLAAGAGPSDSPAASQTGSQTASHTAAQPPADAGFRGDTLPPSIVYKTVDGHALRLFIRRPRSVLSGPRPAVVLFHGGAWRTGGAGRLDALAQELAGQGLVALLVEYRLLPAQERLRVPHEAIADARSAMRYVRQHAVALGVDPDRMAAGGVSAGGHLAMMTALLPALSPDFDAGGDDLGVSPRPQALLLLSAVYEALGHARARGLAERLLHRVTPSRLLAPHNLPPTLALHGMADQATPFASAQAFAAQAKAMAPEAPITLLAFPGHGHGFALARLEPDMAAKVRQAMHGFFLRLGWVHGPLPDRPRSRDGGRPGRVSGAKAAHTLG